MSPILGLLNLGAVLILYCFVWHKAITRRGDLRWLALCCLPFLTTFLVRIIAPRIPMLSGHLNFALNEVLFTTANLFVIAGMGFILLRRSGRARAESDRMHSELAAARRVQRLMLPAQSASVPCLQVQSAYLPAQEVGGDFYQFAQTPDGALLILVGDVSGKGLQAALTVSLIIGFWQKLADASQSPARLLQELNGLLCERLVDGFVTCLCARVESGGLLTLASAGHIAPYLNGTELLLSQGLPLAVMPALEYEEANFQLERLDTFVVLTDGILEARDTTRSFFGFDRLQQALTERLTAEQLAQRAQQFGQEDDITVVSLTYQGAPAAARPPALTASASFVSK